MFLVVWRGLFARKVRVGLTALAIALGVMLMTGTYISRITGHLTH